MGETHEGGGGAHRALGRMTTVPHPPTDIFGDRHKTFSLSLFFSLRPLRLCGSIGFAPRL
jgi:hypothetical protein